MFRWLVGLLLLLALAAGVTYVVAGRGAPPRLTISKPDRAIGQAGTLEVTAEAPNAQVHDADDHARAERQDASRCSRSTPPPAASATAKDASVTAIDRNQIRISRPVGKQSVPELQSGAARIVVTATRPSFLNLRTLTSTAVEGLPGAPRAAADRGGVDASLRQPRRRPRWSSTARRRRTSPRACGSAMSSIRAIRLVGRRSKAAFFALLYDQDLQHADPGVRARRSGQRGEGDVRRQRVREAAAQEPHRARRQVPQPRRAGHPRARAGAEDDAAGRRQRHAAGVSADQRRASEDQRRSDRRAGAEDVTDAAVGGPVRPARQLEGRSVVSPTIAPISTRARKSTGRSTSASTSPSPRMSRSSPPTPAPCSTRTGSASTATASSSTTAWACSRSTATCRRST